MISITKKLSTNEGPLAGIGGRSPSLPEAELHQLIVSWHSENDLYDELVNTLGIPKHMDSVYLSPKDPHLNSGNNSFSYLISINVDSDIFDDLSMLAFEQGYDFNLCSVQLHRVGLVWDLAFPGQLYTEIEARMLRIAELSLPRHLHTRLRLEWNTEPFDEDSAVNGRVTAYYQNLHKNSKGEYTLVRKPSSRVKMYPKKIDGVWHIRIEVRLTKQFLVRNDIPTCIPRGEHPRWLRRLPLENFLEFATFDTYYFVHAVKELLDYRLREGECTSTQFCALSSRIKELEVAMGTIPACEEKHLAYKMAEDLQAERLKQRIKDGAFNLSYNIFGE